ncbi:hypothetical protein ACMFMF_009560 [Clarireedia jacksonii]
MAIIDKLPGIKVTVTVNGEDLQEYPDEDGPQDVQYKKTTAPPGFSSSKFIECVSDEEFTIALEVGPPFKLDPRYEALLFEVDIDGISIACLAFEREAIQYYPRRAHISESIRRINKTQRAVSKLKFMQIKKVDDAESDRIKADTKLIDNLGEILVSVFGFTRGGVRALSSRNSPAKSLVREVAEKALKGKTVSHGVSFGAEVIKNSPSHSKRQRIYPDGSIAIAIFKFKYRSREALQSELIIPRSPSPELIAITSAPNDARDRTQPSAREQRIAALKQEIDQIKQEGAQETCSSRKRPADEILNPSTGKAYKTSHAANGDLVVDLTDD